LWSRASHWLSAFCTAACRLGNNSSVLGAWSQDALIVRTRHMVLNEDALSWSGLTWTIKPMLTENVLSWLDWRCVELSWLDLNNQTNVDWRRAELAGLTWTIKPMLTEDVLSWAGLTWTVKWNDLPMPVQ